MITMPSEPSFVARRAELLAEDFLQDLKPEFIARPTADFAYDFFIGFQNKKGGINNIAVEIKATEQPIQGMVEIEKKQFDRWAYSNIPILFLTINVKENRIFYAWLSPDTEGASQAAVPDTARISVAEINEITKKDLLNRLRT